MSDSNKENTRFQEQSLQELSTESKKTFTASKSKTSSVSSKHEVLETLNFSRQRSEKKMTELIKQHEICKDIREMIFNTITCSQRQVQMQKQILFDLTQENQHLRGQVLRMREDFKEIQKFKKKKKGEDRKLYLQIEDQQKVRFRNYMCVVLGGERECVDFLCWGVETLHILDFSLFFWERFLKKKCEVGV